MSAKKLNPFLLRNARKLFHDVSVGDEITISWKDFYSADHRFTGIVEELDDWVRLQGKDSYWYCPVTLIQSVQKVNTK